MKRTVKNFVIEWAGTVIEWVGIAAVIVLVAVVIDSVGARQTQTLADFVKGEKSTLNTAVNSVRASVGLDLAPKGPVVSPE